MKVVCVNNKNINHGMNINFPRNNLTEGKIYHVTYNGMSYITVIDDNGIEGSFSYKRFITLEEYRNRKIDQIL